MAEVKTNIPPLLVQRDGAWFIELMLEGGQQTVLAPIGDGAWLVQQLVEKLVLPRLREPPSPYRPAPVEAPIDYRMTEMGHDGAGFYHKTGVVKTYDTPALTADENAALHGYADPYERKGSVDAQ